MASASSSSSASIPITLDIDLDSLIQQIDTFLSQKSCPQRNSGGKAFNMIQPASADLAKFLDGISQGAQMISDQRKLLSNLSAEAGKTAVAVLKQIGNLHMAAAGFLVLASVLERLEKISNNQKQCWLVLKRLNDLAKCLKELKERSGLAQALDKKADEAFLYIVQGAIMCLTQIHMKKRFKFLLYSNHREDLINLDREISHFYDDLTLSLATANAVSKPTDFSPSSTAVGIEDQVGKITQYLDLHSDKPAIAVVVCGIGGIGKTTITDTVFHRLQGFKTCMVRLNENVDRNPSVEKLQAQILEALTGRKYDIANNKIGQEEIKKTLQATKEVVVLYIDNVLRREYVKEILPEKLDNSNKFRLLLTARKTDVVENVKRCGIEHCEVYTIEPLAMDYSKDIICSNLGAHTGGNEMQKIKISQIAKICSGIPLILEVVGGYLRKTMESKMDLDETLERVLQGLESGEPFSGNSKDIMEYESKLMFAYDDLSSSAKDVFLDISIFFCGWNWDEVSWIVGEEELRALEEGALVKRIANKTNVHDVLIGISRKKSENVRITSREQLSYALQDQEIIGKIKGIWLNHIKEVYSDLSVEMLDKMHRSLRILSLNEWTMIKGICKAKFQNLRFFQAESGVNLPFNISKLDQLRFLDIDSWQHIGFNISYKIPATLRVLRLCEGFNCEKLEIFPQFPPKLRDLSLRSLEIRSLASLFELPEGFQHLTKLIKLNLYGCANLFQLPKHLGDLKALQELNLEGCEGLTQLPESIEELHCLKTLNLLGCRNLKQLPANFGMLKSLRSVSLSMCESLQELPESIEELHCLKTLKLSCSNLKQLPANFGMLKSLRSVSLRWCRSLQELPESFSSLSSLQKLDLSYCDLSHLPDNLGNLTSLVKLSIDSCKRLVRLPSSIGKLKSLSNNLRMNGCSQLKDLPEEFCDLKLEMLNLSRLSKLERLPDRFKEFTSLKQLKMEFCNSLVKLPVGFGKLPVLEELDLDSCIRLQELCIDFHCLPSLKKLILSRCVEMEGLWMDAVVKVSSLNFVDISGSCRLEDRWLELRETEDWEILVHTEKAEDDDEERILKKAASLFFNDECSVFDCHGTPFNPSALDPNTALVLVFEGGYIMEHQWKQLMENVQGLLKDCIDSQIIYVRRGVLRPDAYIQKRMKELNGTTLSLTCDYSKLLVAFQILLSKIMDFYRDYEDYAIITTVVDKDGTKQFSEWKNITNLLKESNSTRENYLRLKRLQEVPGDSNTEILRSLLVSEGKDFLLLGNSKQVSIDSLQGKVVLLLVSKIQISPMEFSALKEMYTTASDKHKFEIVWIPILESYDLNWGDFVRTAESMPWPAVRDPWSIQPTALKVVEEDWGFRFWSIDPMLVVVDENGVINCNKKVKRIVERWGMEAYPFSTDQVQKLRMAEWDHIKAKSTLEVLLDNFDCFGQVKKSMLQGQLICLYGGEPTQMFDFASKLSSFAVSDAVQIIYVGRKGKSNRASFEELKHERNRQGLAWLSLSYVEARKFWNQIEDLLEDLDEWRSGSQIEDLLEDQEEAEGYPKSLEKYRVSLGILWALRKKEKGVWMSVVDESGEVVSKREEAVAKLQSFNYPQILMQAIIC